MSSMRLSVLEDAICNWILSSTGLPASNVQWYGQNLPRAATLPWVSMKLSAIMPKGNDWTDAENNPTPTTGAEVLLKTRGVRRCTLSLQCFAAPNTGSTGPMGILSDVVAASGSPTIGDAISAAGIGICDLGTIKPMDGVINSTRFEPRAVVEIGFYVAAELVETATFIQSVQVQSLTTGEGFTVTGTGATGFVVNGIVQFNYIATGAEGSDFFVTMPNPRSSNVFNVEVSFISGAFNVGFMFPNSVGDRTTTTFHVLTTHALTAGDVLQFEVE